MNFVEHLAHLIKIVPSLSCHLTPERTRCLPDPACLPTISCLPSTFETIDRPMLKWFSFFVQVRMSDLVPDGNNE